MKKLNLVICTNGTFDEEKALINKDTEEILCKGDYYHDKIDEYIEGFLHGLKYCKCDVKPYNIIINPDNELFNKLNFYDNEDDGNYDDEE